MQNLTRRRSGIYAFRIAVPIALRSVVGKTEIIESTGTREIALAKIVAGAAGTRWRQRFLELSRLMAVSGIDSMDYQEILRIVSGSPALLAAGLVPLPLASAASGLAVDHLLRAACDGKLQLHVRTGVVRGFLVPEDEFEPIDPELGRSAGVVIPSARCLPSGAVEHAADGILSVLGSDLNVVASELLAGKKNIDLHAMQAPGRHGMWFIPDQPLTIGKDSLEVATHEVEALRRSVAALIEPSRIHLAREHEKASIIATQASAGRKASEKLSKALDHYISHRVKHDVESPLEVKRIRNGCALLIDLDGDKPLIEITTEIRQQYGRHVARSSDRSVCD